MKHPARVPTPTRAASATAAALVAFTFAAGSAGAQPALPSYATAQESIRGRITSLDGKYQLQIRDERGFLDRVRLHDGTVINPTGLRLAPGQTVTIMGRNAGNTFDANEIDTPYARSGAVPPLAYADPAYAYPTYGYPAYGYYQYPYRPYPAYGLRLRYRSFGFRGWY